MKKSIILFVLSEIAALVLPLLALTNIVSEKVMGNEERKEVII